MLGPNSVITVFTDFLNAVWTPFIRFHVSMDFNVATFVTLTLPCVV